MQWQIEVRFRPGAHDAHGKAVHDEVRDLGIAGVEGVEFARLFFLEADAPAEDVQRVATDLLTDPVVERYVLSDGEAAEPDPRPSVTVRRKPGVMDPVALSTVQAAADMGVAVRRCATARKYYFAGRPTQDDLRAVARAVLANPVIEDVAFDGGADQVFRDAPPYTIVQGHPFRVRSINTENLRRRGLDPQIIELLKKAFRMLFDGQADFPDSERLCSVERAFDNAQVMYLVESIRRSASSPAGRFLQPRE